MVIYHLYKGSLVDCFDGFTRYSIGSLAPTAPALEWAAQPHRAQLQSRYAYEGSLAEGTKKDQWFYQNGLLGFYQQRLLVLDRPEMVAVLSEQGPLSVDVVLVRNSPNLRLAEIQPGIQAEHWIFDGSNYPSRVRGWLEECRTLGLNGHATAQSGAFLLEIDRD